MSGHPSSQPRARERGQVLVLFALGLVALVAMAGLVLDGGSVFAQKRDEQNGADMAALAGANAYMNTTGSVSARTAAARAAAILAGTRNGYTDGTDGATLGVSVNHLSSGANVTVDILKPHQNTFARIVGANTWDVGVTATAIAGTIDTAIGAAPWTMSINAFDQNGKPKYDEDHPADFGETNGDFPTSELDIAWTDFNGNNNVNTSEVRDIIDGSNVVVATFDFEQYLGQHNQGNHTALYGEVDQHLKNKTVPIPIVGPGTPNCAAPQQSHQNGCFKGWALFYVTGAQGGSSKTISGYFLSDFKKKPLTVGECTPQQQAAGTCGLIDVSAFGAYIVRLTD
jgi:Flp pilus assembly protein TadG